MKYIIILFLGLFILPIGNAQNLPDKLDPKDKNPYKTMSTVLWKMSEMADVSSRNALDRAEEIGMPIKEESVYIEFVHGDIADAEQILDRKTLEAISGIEVTTNYRNVASAWVPVTEIKRVAEELPEILTMRPVVIDPYDNQGPANMNSDSYNTSSNAGTGMRVAIFDFGYNNLTTICNGTNGPTVGNRTLRNYVGGTFAAGGNHGIACVETVFDHAPAAHYDICKVGSISDCATAVNDVAAAGCDVITHSISRYNQGWGDNTGPACAYAQDAAFSEGMIFCTSAGNRNGSHVQEEYEDDNGDDWHEWNNGGDAYNNFTLSNGQQTRLRMQWDSPSTTDHFDFYLYPSGGGGALASSTNTNDFEEIYYTNNTGSSITVRMAVREVVNATGVEFEIFNHNGGGNFEYQSTEGSSTSPSNSTWNNVLSVAAVDYTDFSDPSGTSGISMSYSSRGPTNGGNNAIDLTGPTNTTTVAYGGSFGGTSCATPNVAGAIVAFWSRHQHYDNYGVTYIMKAMAECYRDWGANGLDVIYGEGGLFLHDYGSNNRYIVTTGGSTASLDTRPYRSMKDIDEDNVTPFHNMIYLKTDEAAAGTGEVIDVNHLYKSVKNVLID